MPTPLQGGKRKELMVLCCSRYEHDTKVTVSAAHTSHSSSLCQFLRQFCKRCPYYFHATLWLKKRRNIQLCKTYEAPRALWSSTGIQRDLEIPTAGARSVNVCRASCTCEPLLSHSSAAPLASLLVLQYSSYLPPQDRCLCWPLPGRGSPPGFHSFLPPFQHLVKYSFPYDAFSSDQLT